MTWSHVIITISPNEQLLSNPWQNLRFYMDGESKSFILQYEAFKTLKNKFTHCSMHCAMAPTCSKPSLKTSIYTQIHHARRQVAPEFRHKKNYTLVERNLDNKLDGNSKTLSHQLLRHPISNECPGPPAPPGFWRLRSHDGPASPKLRPNLRVIFSTDILSLFDSLVDWLIHWLIDWLVDWLEGQDLDLAKDAKRISKRVRET